MSINFSIIVPAYNMENYVSYTLASIVRQLKDKDELIVINDGSSDNTLQKIEEYQRIFPCINIFSTENKGLCAARNLGLNKAKNEYLLFIDSDDLLADGALDTFRYIIGQNIADVYQGKMIFFNNQGFKQAKSYEELCQIENYIDYNNSLLFNCLNPGPRIYKKSFLLKNNINFFEGVMMTEDHYFTNKLLASFPQIYATNNYITLYRKNRDDASTQSAKIQYFKDMLRVQKELLKVKLVNPDAYYKRYINFELNVHLIQKLSRLKKIEYFKGKHIISDIINTIPKKYKQKYLKSDQKIYQYSFLTIGRYYLTSKIVKKIYTMLNARYITLNSKKRLKVLKLIYIFICKFKSVNDDQVLLCIRPKSLPENFSSIRNVYINGGFNVINLETPKKTLFNDFLLMYKLATSKLIFTDGHYFFLRGLSVRKQSKCVQIWHASGAFKTFGCDLYNKGTKEYLEQSLHHTSYSEVCVSSPSVCKFYASAFNIDLKKVLPIGSPRTDELYKYNDSRISSIKEKLNIKDKKVVLYAPTFRETKGIFAKTDSFDVNNDIFNSLENLNDDLVFAVRLHPNLCENIKINNVLNLSSLSVFDALAITDVLVTDYSSIIFDFAFFKKPMIFYAYDYSDYLCRRNFYENYDKFVPGEIITKGSEVINFINSLILNKETYDKYCDQSSKFWSKYMASCDGKVAEKIFNKL